MKSFFAAAALTGFAGVMLFGAFLMVHSGNHSNCLPALMGTSECDANINPLEYARTHLGALAELASAIPAFGALAAFAMLAVFFYAARMLGMREPIPTLRKYFNFSCERTRGRVKEKILKWAALHEKRDPSFAFAASA